MIWGSPFPTVHAECCPASVDSEVAALLPVVDVSDVNGSSGNKSQNFCLQEGRQRDSPMGGRKERKERLRTTGVVVS
jgi:hypothetical protein